MDAAKTLIRNAARVLTMDPSRDGVLGVIEDGAVLLEGGQVRWVGPSNESPPAEQVVDASGQIVMPGLIDCHTHSVWAGSRANEWRRRMAGESYSKILEEGGGILSTVRATRAAADESLLAGAVARLASSLARGVTTIEVKSGYGLSVRDELRLLQTAKDAGELVGMETHRTFLGAHTVPLEWRGDRAGYVRQVIEEQLPAVVHLAHDIDVYVDRGAFSVDEGARILEAGRDLGLGLRIHAEQIAHTGAAKMAAELGAASADHLERLDMAGIEAMAAAGTVATLLPGAAFYLRDDSPPVAAIREAGIPIAVATDLNPGTSPIGDLWGCATLACVTMGLSVEESIVGITRNAAKALGYSDRGVLAPGYRADVAMYSAPPGEPSTEEALVQRWEGHRAAGVWVGGHRRL